MRFETMCKISIAAMCAATTAFVVAQPERTYTKADVMADMNGFFVPRVTNKVEGMMTYGKDITRDIVDLECRKDTAQWGHVLIRDAERAKIPFTSNFADEVINNCTQGVIDVFKERGMTISFKDAGKAKFAQVLKTGLNLKA